MADATAPTPTAPTAPTPTSTSAPAAAAPPAAAPADWTAGFNDVQKGYVQNKGFKGAQDVLDSYINFEKLRGAPQERILTLPENMDTPEGRAVFERLGTPKDAKGYDLKLPKEGGDPKLAEWAAETFLKAGLPKSMGEKVMAEWNARAEATKAATVANQQAAISQAEAALKLEWGMAYEKNVNLAKAGARALELDAKTIDVLEALQGREKLFKTLQKIGQGVGESSFVTGAPANDGTVAPDQAASKISELMSDKAWVSKYLSGDVAAKKEMERLQNMKAGGAMTRL